MSFETNLQTLVEMIVKRNTPLFITEGKIISVDKDKNTCNVDRDDLPELFNVRLNPILEAGENVITVYPQKDSFVLCAIIENNPNDCFLLSANEIESINFGIEKSKGTINKDGLTFENEQTKISVNKNEIVFNGGGLGGLIQIAELVTKINNLEDKVKDHQHLYVNAAGTPTPTTLDPATNPPFLNTKQSDLENEKVKH